MKHISILFTAGMMAYSVTGVAADVPVSAWSSTAELGYVNVSGNTNTETIKAAIDVAHAEADAQWAHKAHAEALSSTSEVDVGGIPTSQRSAARWLVTGQSDYKINESDYFYGLVSYEDDRRSGFQYQAKLGLGYGRRIFKDDAHELKVEIGPGLRWSKLESPAPVGFEGRQSDSFLRVGAGYIWNISETAVFTEDLVAEFGNDQDELKSVTALTANISGALAMKLSYTIKHLDAVPAGTEKTDKAAAVTLVYKF